MLSAVIVSAAGVIVPVAVSQRDRVVVAAVAVIDGVAGDRQRAAARPQHILGLERLGQPGHGVAVDRASRFVGIAAEVTVVPS